MHRWIPGMHAALILVARAIAPAHDCWRRKIGSRLEAEWPRWGTRRIAVREWLGDLDVRPLFIEPGSPWENGFNESFTGKLRDELLFPLEEA